jgi:peroxiredoxin Q/BCP
MSLQAGDVAPEFTLPNEDGRPVALRDLRGRKVVLYFYPKDDTPGCTAEACALRDEFPRFEAREATVLGVSPDDPASHARFCTKHNLPFSLLADTGHEVAEAYGVWGLKKMYGREFLGVSRTTFVIDEEGRIERVFEKVKPAEHAEELLQALGE